MTDAILEPVLAWAEGQDALLPEVALGLKRQCADLDTDSIRALLSRVVREGEVEDWQHWDGWESWVQLGVFIVCPICEFYPDLSQPDVQCMLRSIYDKAAFFEDHGISRRYVGVSASWASTTKREVKRRLEVL